MPNKKPAPKPTLAQRAKATFNRVSQALDPVQQFSGKGKAAIKKARNDDNSMIGRDAVKRRLDREMKNQGASRTTKGNGRRNA